MSTSDLASERRVAIVSNRLFTYSDLHQASERVATALLDGRRDLEEARLAFPASPSFAYAAIQSGIWRAGGVAVPLAVGHPPAEVEYVIRDSGARLIADEVVRLTDPAYAPRREAPGRPVNVDPPHLPTVGGARRAMIVYTSGTTGRPKGVVTTHANIRAQIDTLRSAWEWTTDDRLLLALPLHHVHGIINGLGCALRAGAVCELLPRFDAEVVWDRLASGDITIFTAVPTMYRRLVASWEAAAPEEQQRRSSGAKRLRLMMSGSAALPVQLLERWREITGHTLLERYGMTEIGMALSNPIRGERRAGFVGVPLPGVEVRLVDDTGTPVAGSTGGEIQVRGPSVFLEYWQRPAETRAAFADGWFRTGDMAVVERGAYRILGRTSVDIIKTGGYKVSALEIEEVLRRHPSIAECAVVGVADPEWGERVSAAVELREGRRLSLDALQRWAKAELAPSKVPRALEVVGALPRNAVGKVVKPAVVALFERTDADFKVAE
ncbi:MAG: long-chain fatty acid--CoA ligase [Acidobacteria bacterium RIFCSPLOWO2_12_FULL_65_11]|nr:MAG: long-chain fatty acid--CoA ligase [Acidobacteria bacterium RIFCSPLOWO2_02_FULL_64_15]OFW34186.1 MAG: long-chain fatty acid--CoA ligase [Acidobacteria bacterium RIFCSPLOWO2_12_FULL_65_11]